MQNSYLNVAVQWSVSNDGAGLPTLSNIIDPTSLHHQGTTYTVWQAEDHEPRIAAYYHDIGQWSEPITIGANPLGAGDHHGAPAIVRDHAGYFHVFWGAHAFEGELQYAKSTASDDIRNWGYRGTVGHPLATYPKPVVFATGDLYVFCRSLAGQY